MPGPQPAQNGMSMNKANEERDDDEMRPEYDLRGGVRGKYYERYKSGTNIVVLDDDVADIFKDSPSVNAALRQFLSEHGPPGRSKDQAG